MRVLIADDQDFIRRALRKLLAEEPDIQVCGEAHDGDTAVRMVQIFFLMLVIMDISMPVLDGLQATLVIREFFPKVQVVTVSQYELADGETLLVGARALVPKVAVSERLIPTLRDLPLEETINCLRPQRVRCQLTWSRPMNDFVYGMLCPMIGTHHTRQTVCHDQRRHSPALRIRPLGEQQGFTSGFRAQS